jgi:undecaprenyl-diphosphatase
MVHTVKNYIGGKYGFASSHAANTFAVATFCFVLLRKTHPWVILMFFWAAFVCYTRIYLGVHYPGDLLVGGLIGALLGWLMLRVSLAIEKKVYSKKAAGAEGSSASF